MHNNPSSQDENTNVHDDKKVQAAALNLVLAEHPSQLTIAEISRELIGEDPDFADRDAIERAVRELTGAGLLHRSEALVVASRAALRFENLRA
jgi:hypothetical protein